MHALVSAAVARAVARESERLRRLDPDHDPPADRRRV